MILYLSLVQHSNLLDFTGWNDPDSETSIKKLVGNYVLKQFIIYDMCNFSHFTEVMLDRLAFGDTEFAEYIEEFLTMYSACVTVICEGLSQSDPMFAALLNSGVGNIVCDTEIFAIQQEIRECLSDEGMTRYHPKERTNQNNSVVQYRFDCENVKIAVMSSQPRMGATTTAIGFCTWLQSVGAIVCYVEANTSRHLSILAKAYEISVSTIKRALHELVDAGYIKKESRFRVKNVCRPAIFIPLCCLIPPSHLIMTITPILGMTYRTLYLWKRKQKYRILLLIR